MRFNTSFMQKLPVIGLRHLRLHIRCLIHPLCPGLQKCHDLFIIFETVANIHKMFGEQVIPAEHKVNENVEEVDTIENDSVMLNI